MTAHWLPRARRLAAAGLTLAEIGAVVGRSKVAVWSQLNGKRSISRPDTRRRPKDPETQKRCHLRAAARLEAAATGEPVDAIYARWDVVAIDRSLAWDLRRPA